MIKMEKRKIPLNMRNGYLNILLLVLCLTGLSACVTGTSSIRGEWGFEDKTMGPLVLAFLGDGTFIVDANADGKKDIWGHYDLFGRRIQFRDEEPRVTTDCYEPGFHYYEIDKGVLRFSEFAEQCKPRKYILSYPMKRIKK